MDPAFEFSLQTRGDTDDGQEFGLLDSFLDIDLGQLVWDLEPELFRIQAGQWKGPLNRARKISAREFSFSDRSVASVFFAANRSIGVGFSSETDLFGSKPSSELALFNGIRSVEYSPR